MVGETQFTPEAAKQAVNILKNPNAALTGTANPVLDAARQRYAAGEVENSLKVISGEVVPYTDQDVDRVLIWNLSTNRDASTKEKKDPTEINETTRYNDSKDRTKKDRKFLEERIADADLTKAVTKYLQTSGPFKDVLDAMPDDTAREAFTQELMKLPGYKEQFRELFIERLNPTKRLQNEATVKNLELEIAKLTAQLGTEVTQTDINTARNELDTAKAALVPKTAELLQIQAKTARYQELTNEMAEIKREMRKYEGQGKPLETQRTALLTEKAGLNPTTDAARITQIDTEVKNIEKNQAYANYTTRKAEVAEHTSLTGEIAALQVSLSPLQEEVNKKQEALTALQEKQKTNISPQKKAEIEADVNAKKALLADAKTNLEAEMIKFYRDVTHMAEDAMEKFVNGGFGKLKEIWKDEAAKQAKKDETQKGKLAALGVEKATVFWKSQKTKRGLTFFEGNKDKIKTVLNEAFKPGGAENVALFMESKSATDLGLTADEHTALMDKLKNDPDFRKTQSEGWAKQALADYIIAGGSINQDLIQNVANSEFGKVLVSEGRAKAETAFQQFKDNLGKKGVETNIKSFIKDNWWKFGIGILVLLILLGIVSVAT